MKAIAIGEPEQAATDLVPLATLRKQCEIVATDVDSDGVEYHPDDDLLIGYLESAIERAEDFTGLSIHLRTWEQGYDGYPCGRLPIEITRPPLVELLSFTATQDSDGEVDPSTYTVSPYHAVPIIRPYSDWPIITAVPDQMRVRYRSGYSSADSDAQPLPKIIRQALLMAVAEWYATREETVQGSIVAELPAAAQHLLRPRRVKLGMA